jgi:fluoroacetyl-CoA thioesterase
MKTPSPLNQSDIGAEGQATLNVTDDRTAVAVGSGDLPVLATPMLVAVMEAAAVEALKDRLAPPHTSVGIDIRIKHIAATPAGETVTAKATLTSLDGRTATFSVKAEDRNGTIGSGQHVRAVVDGEKFMAKITEKFS